MIETPTQVIICKNDIIECNHRYRTSTRVWHWDTPNPRMTQK